jgi:hypothetical protein
MIEHFPAGKNITWRERVNTSSCFNSLSVSGRLRRWRLAGPTGAGQGPGGRADEIQEGSSGRCSLFASAPAHAKGANRVGKVSVDRQAALNRPVAVVAPGEDAVRFVSVLQNEEHDLGARGAAIVEPDLHPDPGRRTCLDAGRGARGLQDL